MFIDKQSWNESSNHFDHNCLNCSDKVEENVAHAAPNYKQGRQVDIERLPGEYFEEPNFDILPQLPG